MLLGSSRLILVLVSALTIFLAAQLLFSYPRPLATWSRTGVVVVRVNSSGAVDTAQQRTHHDPVEDDDQLPCRNLSGAAEDVQVVMRTGATEMMDKLPIHLRTTFRCYADPLIFSDHAEVLDGHHVHDALAPVSHAIKQQHPDFDLYRRLQQQGRAGLDGDQLSGQAAIESGPFGKVDNMGWRLDKWKFLPMMTRTLELAPPHKMWFVFVEPDTYLVWSNLLLWLRGLGADAASTPLYFGSEVQIGDDIFAHGGSAFVMSRPAVRAAAEIYARATAELENFTAGHWAGDCVLGKALNDAGVPLSWSWPMFQGGNPAMMDFKESKGDSRNLWCSPALSYHHLSPWEIEQTWLFEQRWIRAHHDDRTTAIGQRKSARLRHLDVFTDYTLPNMRSSSRAHWTNASPVLEPGTQLASMDECRARCEARDKCVQYHLDHDGCHVGFEATMGQPAGDVRSGWIEPRVQAWMDEFAVCSNDWAWTVP